MGQTTQLRAEARDAYDAMAPFYDDFTAHHDYELWLRALLPVARRAGFRGRRVLDVACGTGKSFEPLLRRNWEITACDISEGMLRIARVRAAGRVRLERADMRDLPPLGTFPLIICLGDVLNHLTSAADVRRSFKGFRRNLAPGGVVVFDVNTLHTFQSFFAVSEAQESGEHRLLWEGFASDSIGPGEVSGGRFSAYRGTDPTPLAEVVHHQRHHPPEEVVQSLAAVELKCVAVYGQGFDARLEQPLDEKRHTKAIFVARHANQEGERG